MAQYLIILLPVVIGGFLVWIGSYLSDRRKLRLERKANLRIAYAKWFTSERLLSQKIQVLYKIVQPLPKNIEEHSIFVQETKDLLPAVQDTIQTLHEIYLLESNSEHREMINIVSETLEKLHSAVNGRVLHQKYHLEARAGIDRNRARIAKLPEEIRGEQEQVIKEIAERLDELDATCHASWESFATDVVEFIKDAERQSKELLEKLGGKM